MTWLLIIKQRSKVSSHNVVAILGCSLMVFFDVITPMEVFSSIRGETLLLVIAFMIIHGKLEQRGFAEFLKRVLLYGNPSPTWLLARVSLLSGTLAALIMDNGAVTFLSPLVFRLCDENRLEIEPFMLALATSANIGSIATVIGNVKNLIIMETIPMISFLGFFTRMIPIAIIGLVLNTIFLMFYYRKSFAGRSIKPYKPPKNITTSQTSSTNLLPQNVIPGEAATPHELPVMETSYDSDEDNFASGIMSDSDGRDENSDMESNDDESLHSEGENSNLLARKKNPLLARPQFTNAFSSSPDQIPPPRNYAYEHTVYMNDDDNDVTSPWVIRRESGYNHNQRQTQPALTRFAWAAPNPESSTLGLQGIGSNIQKQTERFISDTKNFFGNGYLWKNSFFITIMFGMYLALFFEKSFGWTTVTVASLLLFIDKKNASNVINKINWGIIVYLIGIFGVMRGLYATPMPDLLWYQYEEMFIRPDVRNISISMFALALMSTVFALTLTSVPAVLLILPYIPNIIEPSLRNNAGYLLAWNVVLIGNLSARRSSAGLIVSEIAKDHLFDTPLIRPHEFRVWGKYSVWSTFIISIVGTLMISSFLK
ncbi:4985_t:CDS:2 [Funneliformis geosporum]|uniref:4985_t:CDS:1 n=1 Tax=Funneliformis geosporum TaxID=1117311 RepID=A0A9W4SIN4_9GLOM|nr:4985_t:CDS:2 [Funneliformis geosporum]